MFLTGMSSVFQNTEDVFPDTKYCLLMKDKRFPKIYRKHHNSCKVLPEKDCIV